MIDARVLGSWQTGLVVAPGLVVQKALPKIPLQPDSSRSGAVKLFPGGTPFFQPSFRFSALSGWLLFVCFMLSYSHLWQTEQFKSDSIGDNGCKKSAATITIRFQI
jgi:hypothetical protein